MRLRATLLAVLIAAATASPALAQRQQQAAQGQAPQAQNQLSGQAWYQQQLSDLATVLGGAHYLRILCQGRGDQRWRDYMQGVINHEPAQRGVLIANFNSGYRDQETRYPVCDRDAQQSEAELRARGLRIANGLSARHAETSRGHD